MNIMYKYIYYSIMYSTCLCCRCTLVQYYVYILYLYIVLQAYIVYSCMLYYYIHLYSYSSLDLVLCGGIRYTIVLCLYMYLYMYDSLILYDCHILICLVCILICVVIASVRYLPNIKHLFGQQCSMVLWCCQVIQAKAIARLVCIELCYRCRMLTCIEFRGLTMIYCEGL